MELTACPACRRENLADKYLLHDDRYGYPQHARLQSCASCEHKFLNPPLSEMELKTLYTQYYQRENADPAAFVPYRVPGKFRGWLDGDASSAATWVPRGVRVLDIGCGLGANVAFHASRDCDAHGVDADANVQAIARQYGLNIRVGLFRPEDYADQAFDYVTMDQVFEHVSDPLLTLREIRQVLKPGGYLVISTPNANGWGGRLFRKKWLNWHTPFHQQFISGRSMAILAEQSGFSVERMSTITRSAWVIYQLAHLLTYPGVGQASVFWAPQKARPRLHQFLMLKGLMATRLTLIPQLATRLFDALGCGDNHLVLLRKKT